MTESDVIEFFSANANRLAVYLINKKGGADGNSLTKEEAYEVMSNVLHYFIGSPDKFNQQYIWNKLKQARIDFIRGKMLQARAYERYALDAYVDVEDHLRGIEVSDMRRVLREEIAKARPASREVLEVHYIDGKPLISERDKAIRKRFKKRMIAKYGGD